MLYIISISISISMMYKTYDKMKDDKKTAITRDSKRFLKIIY